MGLETPSAPEQNEGKQTARTGWESAPRSAEFLQYEKSYTKEKDSKMREIDRTLKANLGAKEYVDAYDGEKARALTAMKAPIDRAYKILIDSMKITDTNPDRLEYWKDFYKECTDDVSGYQAIIFRFIKDVADRSGKDTDGKAKKIGLDEIFDLSRNGRVIYTEMSKDPMYKTLMRKISVDKTDLTPADYDYMIQKLPEKMGGILTPEESVELMKGSGVLTLVFSMDPLQRMKFAETIIATKPEKAEALLFGLVSAGYLSMGQMEKLMPKMKGDIATLREKMVGGQTYALKIQENIKKNLRQASSTNAAIRFTQPQFLAATAATLWGVSNIALAATVTIMKGGVKAIPEFLGSGWVQLQALAVLAGSALYGNPTLIEWISKKGRTNESRDEAKFVTIMIMQEADISRRYFEKPLEAKNGKQLQGTVELIAFMRSENEKKHQGLGKVTAKDMLAVINDPANANKETIRNLNPKVKEDLMRVVGSKDQVGFEKLATVVYAAREMRTTAQMNDWAVDIRKLQGIKTA